MDNRTFLGLWTTNNSCSSVCHDDAQHFWLLRIISQDACELLCDLLHRSTIYQFLEL